MNAEQIATTEQTTNSLLGLLVILEKRLKDLEGYWNRGLIYKEEYEDGVSRAMADYQICVINLTNPHITLAA